MQYIRPEQQLLTHTRIHAALALLQTRATRMNDNSSRSHEIVRLYVESRPLPTSGRPRERLGGPERGLGCGWGLTDHHVVCVPSPGMAVGQEEGQLAVECCCTDQPPLADAWRKQETHMLPATHRQKQLLCPHAMRSCSCSRLPTTPPPEHTCTSCLGCRLQQARTAARMPVAATATTSQQHQTRAAQQQEAQQGQGQGQQQQCRRCGRRP